MPEPTNEQRAVEVLRTALREHVDRLLNDANEASQEAHRRRAAHAGAQQALWEFNRVAARLVPEAQKAERARDQALALLREELEADAPCDHPCKNDPLVVEVWHAAQAQLRVRVRAALAGEEARRGS